MASNYHSQVIMYSFLSTIHFKGEMVQLRGSALSGITSVKQSKRSRHEFKGLGDTCSDRVFIGIKKFCLISGKQGEEVCRGASKV